MGVITVYLALGSNLGNREATIGAARRLLAQRAAADGGGEDSGPIEQRVRLSPVYETAPVGGPAGQGPFLNAAAALATGLGPRELLTVCQGIERELGRPPRDQRDRWGPRVLDLDLLFYADAVIDEPGLRIPHPRMHERWFVLKPLADLAPDAVHPVLGRTVRELLEALAPDEHG